MMSGALGGRLCGSLLLLALVSLVAIPRVFVVCVSEGDHVAIEAGFETVPCEASLEFPGWPGSGSPADSCIDTPAIQLSARTDVSNIVITVPDLLPLVAWEVPRSIRPVSRQSNAPSRPPTELLALKTIVLRI